GQNYNEDGVRGDGMGDLIPIGEKLAPTKKAASKGGPAGAVQTSLRLHTSTYEHLPFMGKLPKPGCPRIL
ncbi:MAG: hypothetical protein AAGD06_33375, partial [Acidobacteriota bacterium]